MSINFNNETITLTASGINQAIWELTKEHMIVSKCLIFKNEQTSLVTLQTYTNYVTAVGLIGKDEFQHEVPMCNNNRPNSVGLDWILMGQGKAQGRYGHMSLVYFKSLMMTEITDPETGEILKEAYQFVGTVPTVRGKDYKTVIKMAYSFIKQDRRDTAEFNKLIETAEKEKEKKRNHIFQYINELKKEVVIDYDDDPVCHPEGDCQNDCETCAHNRPGRLIAHIKREVKKF